MKIVHTGVGCVTTSSQCKTENWSRFSSEEDREEESAPFLMMAK